MGVPYKPVGFPDIKKLDSLGAFHLLRHSKNRLTPLSPHPVIPVIAPPLRKSLAIEISDRQNRRSNPPPLPNPYDVINGRPLMKHKSGTFT